MRHDRCLECNFNANRLENKQHNADKGWLCSLASEWKRNQVFLGCASARRWGGEDVSSRLNVGGILVWGTRQWATAFSLQVRAQFTSLRGCFVSISHKWTLKRHEASLNPMSLVCAGSCHCILQFCCQWKWEIDPRPATKPPSCWHFNCFIPGGSQLCGCECLIHQTLQASHFQWAETPKSTTCNRSESRQACRDDVF